MVVEMTMCAVAHVRAASARNDSESGEGREGGREGDRGEGEGGREGERERGGPGLPGEGLDYAAVAVHLGEKS